MTKKAIFYKGKVVFEKVQMSGQFERFPKVFQEDEACFLYMSKGSFNFRSPVQLIEVKEGEAVVAKCGNYFIEQSNTQKDSDIITVIGAYFYPQMIKTFFEADLKLIDFNKNYDVNKAMVEPLMKSCIESINYLIDNPELTDENLTISKLKELLLLLGKADHSIHEFVNSLFTPFEYNFKEIIAQNTHADLSQEELAKLCGCSLATYKRRFAQYFNQSPAKYLLQKKLEKSFQLLSVQSISISEIAYECGFKNVNHFNKAFKKHYRFTPTQIRLSQKDKNVSF